MTPPFSCGCMDEATPVRMSSELTIIKQRRWSDCGPAALATVIEHHGSPADSDYIADAVALGRGGTDLLSLSQVAKRLGFWTQGSKGSYNAIPNLSLPVIAHVRRLLGGGHFVVVYGWNPLNVVLADPAIGIRKVSRRAFCRQWTGYLLTVAPAPRPQTLVMSEPADFPASLPVAVGRCAD
jgi:ABC-type bacteriocin/lantibiotic exporter with double-glycine peptidase domain